MIWVSSPVKGLPENVDVSRRAACAELGQEQSALEDEVFAAGWRCRQPVEKSFEDVLDHEFVGGAPFAAC
ncbi:hypothetical protein EV643_1362 [Kribbella sp. VKM Ac-2527]|uniref:Uncharacterized protein n=1 Tax=Kribbella caucasensis TaxID=2512215 RepID=A0A4R6J5C3_9ACTN|nr:hypothetical protein EV643_1362 [Kribbella sp. VKM Ac-2527]